MFRNVHQIIQVAREARVDREARVAREARAARVVMAVPAIVVQSPVAKMMTGA